MNNPKYITVSTQYFKTHFAKLVRDIQMGDEDGIKVKSHGRLLGIFVPLKQKKKSADLNDLIW